MSFELQLFQYFLEHPEENYFLSLDLMIIEQNFAQNIVQSQIFQVNMRYLKLEESSL